MGEWERGIKLGRHLGLSLQYKNGEKYQIIK
jgi:hypothetical protein